jgi:riboflavin transporter FmnP
MKPKTVAVIIAFTALTTALNFFRVPAPFLPAFSYQLGDVVLVVAFLLFNPLIGLSIAFLNMIVNIIIPTTPAGVYGPPYYFLAVTTMLLGVFISDQLIARRRLKTQNTSKVLGKPVVAYTGFSILTRVLLMLPCDYFIYGFLVSLVSGLSMSASYALVLSTMPLIIIYNVSVPLIVIPISYYITERVAKTRIAQSLIS